MSKKILIVDDDVDLSTQMAEVLRDEGHQVDVKLLTLENLPSFNPRLYDVFILDFKMPDVSGVDVLKSIKEKALKTKIFFITGKPAIEKLLKDENLSSLVAEIISKPFSIENLLHKIDNA